MVRMPAKAWWFLVAGFPAIVFAGATVAGTAGDTPVFSPWYTALPALVLAMFFAGTVEELGWRGVALPLLQRRFTPLVSGLLLGLVWAAWHLPAFALSGTVQSAWSFGPYLAGLLALSVIMTWFFNVSNGSILVAWLVHFQAMNPLFPDAQPWDSLFYVIAAVLIVAVNRHSMLRRDGAVVGLERPDAGRE
jgi:membrane protease YdiL (CAAX protease family)